MLKSYFTIALKNLTAQKLYSTINILGLTVGLMCFMLIMLFVRYELSYDGFWADADRIYRVSREYFPRAGARARLPASANAPIGPALVEEFPEIETAARVFGGRSEQAGRAFGARSLLGRDDIAIYEDRLRFADNELFEVFDLDWLQGDPATALAEPNTIVLSESLAAKYFGSEDPLGRSLSFNGRLSLGVTGVIRDLPPNTHLSLDAVASLGTLTQMAGPEFLENWQDNTDFHTYVRLHDGAGIEAVEARTGDFLDRHIENGSSFSDLRFMNVTDIHLRSNRDEEWKAPGNIGTVLSFGAIAFGILLIACINFMNLSTARAATRAREVAVRKSMGATKLQMIRQFLGESLFSSALATILAIALIELVLPAFRAFTNTALPFEYFDDPVLSIGIVCTTVIVGLIAGSYPAFYLSAFEPAKVLKGELTKGRAGAIFRNVLVIFQFSIAIALLIGTAVVYQQTRYARNIDLGFDKDQIVLLTGTASFELQWETFRQELLSHPGVLNVTASHYTPFSFDDNSLAIRRPGSTSFSRIQYVLVEHGFFETYDIEFLSGRRFSPEIGTDRIVGPSAENPYGGGSIVLNEAAGRLLGWSPDEAENQAVHIGLSEDFSVRVEGTVIGVVNDTHFESIEVAVRPLMFVLNPGGGLTPPLNIASIRVAGAGLEETLAHIDATWREFQPERPVTRHLLDQDFEALYQAEQRQGRLFTAFSLLAIFVACLGLLGLASFATEQRTKEIGIRKVMGGSVLDIVRLLTGEFSKLVIIASLIAWPVGYLVMRQWLDNFAYRIDLGWMVFAGSALIALAVAVLTVGTIAVRAAAANPVNSLRYE